MPRLTADQDRVLRVDAVRKLYTWVRSDTRLATNGVGKLRKVEPGLLRWVLLANSVRAPPALLAPVVTANETAAMENTSCVPAAEQTSVTVDVVSEVHTAAGFLGIHGKISTTSLYDDDFFDDAVDFVDPIAITRHESVFQESDWFEACFTDLEDQEDQAMDDEVDEARTPPGSPPSRHLPASAYAKSPAVADIHLALGPYSAVTAYIAPDMVDVDGWWRGIDTTELR